MPPLASGYAEEYLYTASFAVSDPYGNFHCLCSGRGLCGGLIAYLEDGTKASVYIEGDYAYFTFTELPYGWHTATVIPRIGDPVAVKFGCKDAGDLWPANYVPQLSQLPRTPLIEIVNFYEPGEDCDS